MNEIAPPRNPARAWLVLVRLSLICGSSFILRTERLNVLTERSHGVH